MSKYASKVVEIALNEVGYLEKKTNSQLDDKTANAGYGNYAKYARDLDAIPNFYNGRKNGFHWCDVFVDWVFVQAFGTETAKKLLCQPDKSCGAGCIYSASYYKAKGQFHTKNPKPGDQIFFWNGSKTDVAHTGIVYKVDSQYVYTVEGNTSAASGVVANGGGVAKKKYALSYARIYGYGRPAFDAEPATEGKTENTTANSKGESTVNIELKVLKSGSTGEQVKNLQRLLIAKGYTLKKYGADGDFGGETETAVKAFQKVNYLTVDGIVGLNTWSKLLKG